MSVADGLIRERTIGAHYITMSVDCEDGLPIYQLSVDCMFVSRGSQKECEGKWRAWVRALNAIARKREEKRLENELTVAPPMRRLHGAEGIPARCAMG